MKTVVTGATGFLGGALALRLNSMGFDVLGMGRNVSHGKRLVDLGMRFAAVDLPVSVGLENHFAGCEVAFHCAGLSSPWGTHLAFEQANVVATQKVVDACLKAGVKRLVHISTPSIYIEKKDKFQIGENDPLPIHMINAYAKTKYQAEKVIDKGFADGLSCVTLRPQALIGAGDETLMPRFLRAVRGGKVPLFRGGECLIDVTAVDNVVDACLCAMAAPHAALGKKFNITNDDPRAMKDLMAAVLGTLGIAFAGRRINTKVALAVARGLEGFHRSFLPHVEPVLTDYTVTVLTYSRTLSIEAARAQLGYQPRVSIEDALIAFAQWWRTRA